MEFIGSIGAMIGIGGSGAAAGGAAAGATASGLTALQWVSGAVSAIASIGAGAARAGEMKAQAAEQDFAARDEYIRGRETSAALKLELARTVSDQAVAFAAGGVDLGSVSVQQAKLQATRDAERELSVTANEALTRSLQRRRMARNLRASASSTLFASVVDAGSGLLQTGMDVARRGSVIRSPGAQAATTAGRAGLY